MVGRVLLRLGWPAVLGEVAEAVEVEGVLVSRPLYLALVALFESLRRLLSVPVAPLAYCLMVRCLPGYLQRLLLLLLLLRRGWSRRLLPCLTEVCLRLLLHC